MKTEQQIREEQDELSINQAFEELLDDYSKTNHRKKFDIIRKAFNFANSAHKGIRRQSGEPYIMHPIAVAKIVVNEIGLGSTSICAALLHDVVEDTDYTIEDLEGVFGKKIAQIVDGLTKISGGIFGTRDSTQAENFRHLLLTMSEDIRVVLIKIADRLHNLRTLSSLLPAKQYKIAGETKFIYAPLALRLGLYSIKTELENLSFKYEHPEIYEQLSEKLKETQGARSAFAKEFQQKIEKKLHELGYEFTMRGRVKTPFSIWDKMQKENVSFEEIYDALAFRIVFKPNDTMSEKDQCWIIYSAITTIYKPHPERIRDWVSTPKANGYEALHVTVMGPQGKWVEVQIRSQRMDEIAEFGLAAHWKYKTGENDKSELDKWLQTIRELLATNVPSAIDFIDTFRLDLFASEIFVFTPKGDIKTIANGATALDFAFAIHSNLGQQCIGAKVNHKLVPLSYKLHGGDQIEIITSKIQSPQREWLDFVTTAKARQKLQAFFRKEEKILIAAGQNKFSQALNTLNINADSAGINKILNYYHIQHRDQFYLNIGKGLINLDELNKIFTKPTSKNLFRRYWKNPFATNSDKVCEIKPPTDDTPFKIDMNSTLLLTEETAGKLYKLANCCHPIPGDDVLGYVDNETVMIHKRNCPVADTLKSKHGERILSAQWATHKQNSFLEQIEIKGIDKQGVMIEILQVISQNYGFKMNKVDFHADDGIFSGKIFVYVHDTNEINELCRQLEKNSHINSVTRIQEISNA